MAQYYRQYINGYMDVAGPLYDMLKEDRPEFGDKPNKKPLTLLKTN